jgi:tripartite-type tricarboxylate transporter receptor subunit TctC
MLTRDRCLGRVLAGIAAVLAVALASPSADGQSYPENRPITLVVPFAAGL